MLENAKMRKSSALRCGRVELSAYVPRDASTQFFFALTCEFFTDNEQEITFIVITNLSPVFLFLLVQELVGRVKVVTDTVEHYLQKCEPQAFNKVS